MKILAFVCSIVARYRRHEFVAETRLPNQVPDQAIPGATPLDTTLPQPDLCRSSDKSQQQLANASRELETAPRTTALTTLESALKTLNERQIANPSGEDRECLQRAFSNLHTYLERYDITQHPLTFMPWLMLIARRLSQLSDPRQTDQGLTLIGRTLHVFPDLALAHELATQLAGLPEELQQRTLTVLEDVLRQNGDLPQAHVDILVALTGALHCQGCRERIDGMIQTALTQLRLEPVLSGEIRLAMIKGYSQGHGDTEMTLLL